MLTLICALALADAVTGFLHWLEDKHPAIIIHIAWIFGLDDWARKEIIEPNQLHHIDPYALTRGDYWSRVNTSVYVALPFIALALWLGSWLLFWLALFGSQANQIHYYAHLPDRDLPWLARLGQRWYILQSRRHHSAHHASPFDTRFCVMTPWLNSIIDLCTRKKALQP